jgi:SEC-C motif domain protein
LGGFFRLFASASKTSTMNEQCPCGSGSYFLSCCDRYLSQGLAAPTAEALMRSRYTAFTLAHVDYILRTYHPKTRPINQRQQILSWAKSVQWLGLTILGTSMGDIGDTTGTVEFIAHYTENGKPGQIHEKSVFKKEKDQWFYVSGSHY